MASAVGGGRGVEGRGGPRNGGLLAGRALGAAGRVVLLGVSGRGAEACVGAGTGTGTGTGLTGPGVGLTGPAIGLRITCTCGVGFFVRSVTACHVRKNQRDR
jgi:hypothetical protein